MKEEETLILSLNEDSGKKRLLSLLKGKNCIIKLRPQKLLYCADEEGMKLLLDVIGSKLSGMERVRMERSIALYAIQLDEDEEISFADLSEMMSEAGLEQDGNVSVEVTEHLLRIAALQD